MIRGIVNSVLGAAGLAVIAVEAAAHPAGGTTDLHHGLDHVLSDPLHLLSLAGIAGSIAAGVFVVRRLVRRSGKSAERR